MKTNRNKNNYGFNNFKSQKLATIFTISVFSFIIFLSIGFSAFNTTLQFENLTAQVLNDYDIRISNLNFTSNNSTIQSLKYSPYKIYGDVLFTSLDSTLDLEVTVTNLGNEKAGIASITGLNDDLEIKSISGYNIGDAICDDSNNCTLGISKTFYITIGYKDDITAPNNNYYSLDLNFDFQKFYNVSYQGFACNNCITEILGNTKYNEVINIENEDKLSVTMDGEILTRDVGYTYDTTNKYLTIDKVTGNLNISYQSFDKDEAVYSWDVSSTNDNSILAYAFDNDNDGYWEIYIETQSNATDNSTLKIIYNASGTQSFYDNSEIIRNKVEAIHFVNQVKANKIADGMFSYIAQPDDSNSGVYDIDNLITSHCTSMKSMFQGYGGSYIDLKNFDVSNVSNLQGIFSASKILELDLSNWDTKNVTTLQSAFSSTKLKKLNVSNWDTSKVTMMWDLFFNSTSLENLDLSDWDSSNSASFKWAFRNLTSLKTLNISGWNFNKDSSLEALFYGDANLEEIILTNVNTSGISDMSNMFNQCYKLKEVDLSSFNFSSVTNMGSMFQDCRAITTIKFSDNIDTSKVTNLSNTFRRCENLENINVENFDTQNVTTMTSLFYQNYKIQNLDLSKWNTSKVTNFGWTFREMKALKTLNISNFDFSSATNVEAMIFDFSALPIQEIDASNVDFVGLENTTNFSNMFNGLSTTTNIIVKNDNNQVTWFNTYFPNKFNIITKE